MANKDEEEGKVDRITGRLDRTELRRVVMPDGGEVYRGEIASRALESLGARAFTVDRTIIVGDDFDPYLAEDRALYAHEQYHVEQGDGGGGGGGENFRDAEEVAARAVESMVLSRMAAGGYEAGYSKGAGGRAGDIQSGQDGAGVGARPENAATKKEDADTDPDAERGYETLIAQGYTHTEIVDEMTRRVLTTMDEQHEITHVRSGRNKGFS
ncbi:MAG: eCIS core domain-containing protein [Myxococcota bacterium]